MFGKIVTYTLIAALFASCFPTVSVSQDASYTIAVLDLDADGVSHEEARHLSDELRTNISHVTASPEMRKNSSVSYAVVECSRMDKIFDELDITNASGTDMASAIEIGKMLNVRGIVIGSAGRVDETYTLDISLVDIERSATLKRANYAMQGTRDGLVSAGIPDIARALFGPEKTFPWKKTLYITAAIIGVGIIYFATRSPEEETKGGIAIEIPAPQE